MGGNDWTKGSSPFFFGVLAHDFCAAHAHRLRVGVWAAATIPC